MTPPPPRGQPRPERPTTPPSAPPTSNGRNDRQRPTGPHAVGYGGEIITATMVEQRITRLSDELESLTADLARFAEVAAIAEIDYKAKYAKRRLIARDRMDGHGPGGRVSNDEADDHALSECENELRAHLIAQAVYASARDSMFTKGRQLDALRTISANIRAQS